MELEHPIPPHELWIAEAARVAQRVKEVAGSRPSDLAAFLTEVQHHTVAGAKLGISRRMIMKALGMSPIRLDRWLALGKAGTRGFSEWAVEFQLAEVAACVEAEYLATGAAIGESKTAGVLVKRAAAMEARADRDDAFLESLPLDDFSPDELQAFIDSDGRTIPDWVLSSRTQAGENMRLRAENASLLGELAQMREQLGLLSNELMDARRQLLPSNTDAYALLAENVLEGEFDESAQEDSQ